MDNELKIIFPRSSMPLKIGFEDSKMQIIVEDGNLIILKKCTLGGLFSWATRVIEYEGDIYIINEEKNLYYILEPNAEI